MHFGGEAGEEGGMVTQQPPGPCPDFLVGSSQLILIKSTQVDEHIQM